MLKNLSHLDMPAFLLNCPFSISSAVPNNQWMLDAIKNGEDLKIDQDEALGQWYDLYSVLSSNGIVQLLPTPSFQKGQYQDLAFVANIGIVLTHLQPKRDVVIISNFTSEPRQCETPIGKSFFELSGYETIVCPFKFEGEADLKHIRDNIYIGGYGMRTDIKAFEWMEENFDMHIIKCKITKPSLYHFDCSLSVLTKNVVLFDDINFTEAEKKAISEVVEIVPIKNHDWLDYGITNTVRCHSMLLVGSDFQSLDPTLDEEKKPYQIEKGKLAFLEDVCMDLGLEVNPINLSAFYSSGAALSCDVLHLNRFSYNFEMI